jgi:hypothetical protein
MSNFFLAKSSTDLYSVANISPVTTAWRKEMSVCILQKEYPLRCCEKLNKDIQSRKMFDKDRNCDQGKLC